MSQSDLVHIKRPRTLPDEDETKLVNLGIATYAVNTTGSVTLIATIPQGTGIFTRVGKHADYRQLEIRGVLKNATVGGPTDPFTRASILLIYDKFPTGTLPTMTTVLQTATSYSPTASSSEVRFIVIRRFDMVTIGPVNAATPGSNSCKIIDETIDLKCIPVVFKDLGTGAIDDISMGALYCVVIGNTAAAATTAEVTLQFRTRYSELY